MNDRAGSVSLAIPRTSCPVPASIGATAADTSPSDAARPESAAVESAIMIHPSSATSADDVVAYRVGDLVMAANAGYGESTLDMTGGAASDGAWSVIADSTDALSGRATPPDADAETVGHGACGTAAVTLPARSFTVWRLRADDAQ